MKLTRIHSLLSIAAAFVAVPFAQAVTFTLDSTTATIVPGNTVSTFYEATTSSDSGTMAATFTFAYSGTASIAANDPFKIEIFFNGPQPVLSSAFFKAGNDYMLWDSTDLSGFNSGIYTSITLVGNGLTNSTANGPTAYLGLSHAGLNGTAGTTPPPPGGGAGVPDGGSTVLMLGLCLMGLAVGLRRRS